MADQQIRQQIEGTTAGEAAVADDCEGEGSCSGSGNPAGVEPDAAAGETAETTSQQAAATVSADAAPSKVAVTAQEVLSNMTAGGVKSKDEPKPTAGAPAKGTNRPGQRASATGASDAVDAGESSVGGTAATTDVRPSADHAPLDPAVAKLLSLGAPLQTDAPAQQLAARSGSQTSPSSSEEADVVTLASMMKPATGQASREPAVSVVAVVEPKPAPVSAGGPPVVDGQGASAVAALGGGSGSSKPEGGGVHGHPGGANATPTPRTPDAATLEALASRGLTAALQQKGGTLTMRLIPETLGSMKIQMDVKQGIVNVNLEVGTAEAHRLLTQSLDTLRTALESRGLAVDKLGVQITPNHAPANTGGTTLGQSQAGTPDTQNRTQDAAGSFMQHDAGDGRSRSWLGGDQRDSNRHGGAGPHTDGITDSEAETSGFGGVWQRLRLGVNATA